MKQVYGIDMEQTQRNKLISDIPVPDVVIFMGCNVSCPNVPSQYTENWGLDDPSGKGDEVFLETIRQIEEKMLKVDFQSVRNVEDMKQILLHILNSQIWTRRYQFLTSKKDSSFGEAVMREYCYFPKCMCLGLARAA